MIPLKEVECCPLCGEKERTFLFFGREHEYETTTQDEFAFFRCTGCSLVYMAPRPDESALSLIYPRNYYSQVSVNASPDDVNLDSFAGRMLHRRLLGRMAGNMKPYLTLSPTHSILDVGCGGGRSLKSLNLAFGCKAVGIDLDVHEDVAKRFVTPPIIMIRGNFLDYDFGGEKFDVVYASHLIEHLPNPVDFLRKAHACTKVGGLCIIETPNVDCSAFFWFGKHWGGHHIPRHWFLLSAETAKMSAEKSLPGGWEVLDTRFSPNAAFWIWTFHSRLVSLGFKRVGDFLFPSDHRIVSVDAVNMARHAALTALDALIRTVSGRTGNMSVIFRRVA